MLTRRNMGIFLTGGIKYRGLGVKAMKVTPGNINFREMAGKHYNMKHSRQLWLMWDKKIIQ